MTRPRALAFFTEPAYRNDRLFDPGVRSEPFGELRTRLAACAIEAHTADVFSERRELPDLVISIDAPRRPLQRLLPRPWADVARWAVLCEPEVTLPPNGNARALAQFDRVFTWRRSLVDNARVFELRTPHPLDDAAGELHDPDRFCVMIVANKRFWHPMALYPERRKAIRWFERNHPTDFDLYGRDWDFLVVGGPRPLRALNVLLPRAARRLLAPRFTSYGGPIADKLETLSHYRFSICYENSRDIDGYVTEKLLDCLVAGAVPLYWGAPDITDFVPAECFVDVRDFESYDDLYAHLRSLSEEEYARMRDAGQSFLHSERARVFGFERWLDTLTTHIGAALADARQPFTPRAREVGSP